MTLLSRGGGLLWVAISIASLPTIAAEPLRVPFFKQQKNGCGAASVAMVLHYWGHHGQAESSPDPREVYRALYDTNRKAIPLASMRHYVEDFEFRAFTLRGRWDDLDRHLSRGRPIIVGLRPSRKKGIHFAVLVGIDGDRLWLNDPTRKKPHRMRRSDFEQQWQLAENWLLLAAPSGSQ
jgi:ABC-type bacteriocin/lantibiotic exporter with double-glycine peptidase domain